MKISDLAQVGDVGVPPNQNKEILANSRNSFATQKAKSNKQAISALV